MAIQKGVSIEFHPVNLIPRVPADWSNFHHEMLGSFQGGSLLNVVLPEMQWDTSRRSLHVITASWCLLSTNRTSNSKRFWKLADCQKERIVFQTSFFRGYMDVSKKKSGNYPQIIHFDRVFHYKQTILGYPLCFGNTHMKLQGYVSCNGPEVAVASLDWIPSVLGFRVFETAGGWNLLGKNWKISNRKTKKARLYRSAPMFLGPFWSLKNNQKRTFNEWDATFFVSGKPHLNESHGRPVEVTLAMLLMAEIRRSPVERKVVYPIMFKAWKMYIPGGKTRPDDSEASNGFKNKKEPKDENVNFPNPKVQIPNPKVPSPTKRIF